MACGLRRRGLGSVKLAEYYKHEIAKWNVATDDLTLEQEAAYHRVVAQIRLYERPLSNNLRVLAGLWRCNERRAKRLLAELVDAGKLSVDGASIIDEKAVKDASTLRQSRVDKQLAGRQGGIESGKSRRKSLENNETGEAPASTREEKRREEKSISSSRSSARESENQISEPDQLYDEVLSACGLTSGRIPTYWMPPAATREVWKWRSDLGLTNEQIVDVARAERQRHDDPPKGPMALNNAMQRFAGTLTAPPLTAITGGAPQSPAPRKYFTFDKTGSET